MATHDEATTKAVRRQKQATELELLDLPNVHAIDIGEKITAGENTGELCIVVYVDKKRNNLSKKNQVPAEFNGIKTDVQEDEPDVLHPAMMLVDDQLQEDATRYSTLEGGISMGPCRSIFMSPPDVDVAGNYVTVGTLGCLVRDRATNDVLALTNFHVAAVDSGWAVGDTMAQPSLVDGGSCPADRFGALQRAVLSANIDGAVVSVENRPFAFNIREIGPVRGTNTASVGMDVRKRGRTTELTSGEVISIDYTTQIDYGDGIGMRTLVNQIRIAAVPADGVFGQSGDSGSVVVDDDDKVVGLYFAGNGTGTRGVASPIAAVLNELDVDMATPIIWVDPGKNLKDALDTKSFKEFIKEKPEKFEKIEKLEKSEKFEKNEKAEKPEKLEKNEKLEIEGPGGGKRFGPEKGLQREKDPVSEFNSVAPQNLQSPSAQGPGFGGNLGKLPMEGKSPLKDLIKDKGEWKEYKDESKEWKELKDQKDKEKEIYEGGPGGWTLQGPGVPGDGGFHFIPSAQRPDLSQGALRNEQ